MVGVYSKETAYGNEPPMPPATWAERAYTYRALDPSLGQSMSFATYSQLKLRLEVPLWMDLAETRHPPMDTRPDESDADSGVTGGREPSPRYAQPVPVGAADPLELSEEESTEGDEAADDPTYVVSQGHGRFAIRYSRLATAFGNFDKGNARKHYSRWLADLWARNCHVQNGVESPLAAQRADKIEQRGTVPSLSLWLPPLPRGRRSISKIWQSVAHRSGVGAVMLLAHGRPHFPH